jgi:alkaline phosphatase D
MNDFRSGRRSFLLKSGVLAAAAACRITGAPSRAWAQVAAASPSDRPLLPQGIAIGDVLADRAIVWARSDRPARLVVEWDTSDTFQRARRVLGPHALDDTDFTARVDLTQLPPDQRIFLRVSFQSLRNERAASEPVFGNFSSAPENKSKVRFVWTGDTAGQGFGINPDFGGMLGYEAMRKREPDFFIHSGDTIYADGIIPAEQTVEEGKIWRNLTTPEKSKVAETLDEFRGNYRYNLLDENVRRFNAEVPQIWQWDDHEVTNNWSSSKDLSANANYTEKNIPLLVARGKKAFLEYAPLRTNGDEERERVYRHIPYSPLLDVFVVDMRSYRGPNTTNLQETASDETTFLGRPQLRWLKQGLSASNATWKVIAADMPIGLLVKDGTNAAGQDLFEAVANGNGPVLGREQEIAELLRFIKKAGIKNTVWLTADVHYTAAHYYDPAKARFTDFDPFWEFVAGPINAGAFGPNDSDDTFGQQVMYSKFAPAANYSPLSGFQFFGEVNIDGKSRSLSVTLRDIFGEALFEQTLEAC